MKYSLLFLFFAFAIFKGFAQVTLTLTPEVVNAYVHPDSFEVRAKATLKNTSNQTKKFTWTRTIKNMTLGWVCLVCDKINCWSSGVNTSPDPLELAAGATSNLDVYIRPDKKTGAAVVELKVVEIGNETNTITGKYNFPTLTRTKDLSNSNNNIRIYPNPTIDFFQITEIGAVDKVVIYNIIGRQIRSFKAIEGTKYYVNDLPDGLYYIRLLNSVGGTVKTIRLSKAHPRA